MVSRAGARTLSPGPGLCGSPVLAQPDLGRNAPSAPLCCNRFRAAASQLVQAMAARYAGIVEIIPPALQAAAPSTDRRNWRARFCERYHGLTEPQRRCRRHEPIGSAGFRCITGGAVLNDVSHGSDRAANNISADSDALILVDEADREVGFLSKALCHNGQGLLHRAFSLLIFNGNGELLLQQRAPSKRLWPLYWSNSCCSHPRRGETMDGAIKRRLYEELGLSCPLHFLFKFQYQAQSGTSGAEHELCSVYIARCTDEVSINRNEIVGWRWIAPEALAAEMSGGGAEKFTPWFMLEWTRIWKDHRAAILGLQPNAPHP